MTNPVFTLTLTALPEHIDELGHVNNAVWVQWIQQVALAHWYSLADPKHAQDYFWVIVRHEIDYLRPAFAGDRVTGRTWVGEAPRGAKFDRHMEFVGPDGRICVKARTIWAIIDNALPPEDRAAMGQGLQWSGSTNAARALTPRPPTTRPGAECPPRHF